MAADDRAIVVGISRYPAFESLGGPENDARAFAAWLTDPAGGDVPAARVSTVLSSDFPNPKDPSTTSIDDVFQSVIDQADGNGAHGGRRLYLYFAGHGFAPSIDESALLTANATRLATGHHIPGRAYTNWFRTASMFDELVLLMDCCREIKASAPMRSAPWNARIGTGPSRAFIGFATELARSSRERPSVSDGNQVRGRFTEALVSGLQHAVDDTGRVTNKSLPNWVFNLLAKEAEDNHETALNRQEPKFQADDEIVFASVGLPYTLTVTFPPGGQPDLVSGGDLTTVFPPVLVDATTVQWQLKPGLYLLRSAVKNQIVPLIGTGGEEHVAF